MTGNDVIKKAKSFLGEGGSRFWKAYGTGAVDWCCIFVWYVMTQAGAGDLFYDGNKTAWVPTAQEWLAKHGTKVALKDAKAGDIVIMTWGGGSRDHIGFAVKPISSTVLQTIEGNTGSSSCTSSKVLIRERVIDNIYGIYRPKYPQEEKKTVSYGEIRKFKCIQTAHVYKDHSIASGRIGVDTNVGSTYSATKWHNEWVYIPFVKGWVPTSGSGGVYLERLEKIKYTVVNKSGINIYADHTTKSTKVITVIRSAELTATRWYGKWAYFPEVKGWGAMSCLTEGDRGCALIYHCGKIATQFVEAGVIYSTSRLKKTVYAVIHQDQRTDCAHFISFGLQEMGLLPHGTYFWLDKAINGDAKAIEYLKKSGHFTISYPNLYWYQLNLEPGDICGYGYTGGQHTQAFAGKDKEGNPLWVSGGTSDVNGHNYGPKRKTTYETRKINVLIRLK